MTPAPTPASTFEEKRKQLVAQCTVIAHLAEEIAHVHLDLAELHASATDEHFVDFVGKITASRMETLGDILNGMDAVTDEDKWVNPIFEKAHELWPQTTGEK